MGTESFDVIVIGAGPAGYVAAIRAAQLGKKVAIVERQYWGGVCLNVGCIPTKSLLKNAEVAHTLQKRGKELGFSFENLNLDYGVAHKRSRQVSGRLVKGVQMLMKNNDIAVYDGSAMIVSPTEVQVFSNDGAEQLVQTENIIIATGARSRNIPGVAVDGERVITYTEAILASDLPKSVVVIGGGPIGVEFAYVWANYGVQVTIVEMMDRILPLEDPEASVIIAKAYKKLKIKVLTGTQVEGVETADEGVQVTVRRGEELETLAADKALVAIGFVPNVENIGLENAGVTLTDRGNYIEIDEQMRTNVPNIYGIGDVTGKLMLAHVGSAMAMVAAEAIAGLETHRLDYIMMPRCVYCHPQVASFGYTEQQAQEEGFQIKTGKFLFLANGKALGLGEREGYVKLISDAATGKLLGGHLLGPDVTELLPELTLAQAEGLTAADIGSNVHAHPTLSEALMEAAHALQGHAIHG